MAARSKRRRRDRRPSLESLETLEARRLLAGNVSTSFDPVSLTVNLKGDSGDNQIQVVAIPGTVLVAGVGGTTVDGAAFAVLPIPSLANLNAGLGNGDDAIGIVGLMRSVTVDSGNGNDSVGLASVLALGDVSISTGNDADTVAVGGGSLIIGSLKIDTGRGDDSIGFATAVVFGNTSIEGGAGTDSVANLAGLVTVGTQTVNGIETFI